MGLHPPLSRGAVRELRAAAVEDPDPRVRAAAMASLVRAAGRATALDVWRRAARDRSATVRRRAAELAPSARGATAVPLIALLDDTDAGVAETAAWACGEISARPADAARVLDALVRAAGHSDALVRESAIAALGARGDARGLDAILRGCGDRPAVRRRAVLALAPFDGPDVEAALERALGDSDWQVRQAAEDLVRPAADS